jgi:DNA polymerase-1
VTAPIYLVDISAYLHRSMHVVYGDKAPNVQPTDTAFIDHACVMLANTMDKLRIERLAVVCDSTEHSFRCDYFPAYKAERKAHTPVFAAQAPRFFDALRDIDVTVFDEPRFEADDLIASIVGQEEGVPYTIITHDKDLFALVNDEKRIAAYNPMTDVWTRAAEVVKKFGVHPWQLYDYLGLVGDTADGIPGVDGVGAKTAAKLIERFSTIDDMYADETVLRDAVGKKQFESLVANKDNAFLSRRLTKPISCDAITLTGHGDMDAPEADFVRGATLTTKKTNRD